MTLTGTIRTLRETFGFINGQDGIDYFFIPSGLQMTTYRFHELKVGDDVQFIPIEHPKGPRAIEILVKESHGDKNSRDRIADAPFGWRNGR